MSNITGNLGAFTIVSDVIRDEFQKSRAPLDAFTFDVSNTVAQAGQAVTVHLNKNVTPSAIQDVTATPIDYTVTSDLNLQAVTISLVKFAQERFTVSELVLNESPAKDLMERCALSKIQGQANAIVTDVFTAITSGNFVNEYGTTGTYTYSQHCDLLKAAADLYLPSSVLSVVLNNYNYFALVKSLPSLPGVNVDEVLRTGKLEGVANLGCKAIIRSDIMPAGCTGFASTPDAMAVAFRPLDAVVNSYGQCYMAQPGEGEKGVTLRFRKWTDIAAPNPNIAWDTLYGYSKFNGAALIRIR